MKLILLDLCCFYLFNTVTYAIENKPTLAIMDFKTVGDSEELGKGAAEILRTAFVETRNYTVIERGMLEEVLKEQKISVSGIVDSNTAVNIGKIIGARIVVVGSVVKIGKSYTLNIRFVDVQTSEVLLGEKLTTMNKEDIPRLCSEIVKKFLGKKVNTKTPVQEIKNTELPKSKLKEYGVGYWSLGVIYSGGSLKYFTENNSSWELKTQIASDVFIGGIRYYKYISSYSRNPRTFYGFEGDYITYKSDISKSSGFAGGGFIGSDILITQKIGISADFGVAYIGLSDKNFLESASSVEYIFNVGIYYYFR